LSPANWARKIAGPFIVFMISLPCEPDALRPAALKTRSRRRAEALRRSEVLHGLRMDFDGIFAAP